MVAAPQPLDDLIDLLADWLVDEAAREVEKNIYEPLDMGLNVHYSTSIQDDL